MGLTEDTDTIDTIEKCVQALSSIIQDRFAKRVIAARENLRSLESALSSNRNYHQAGIVLELDKALAHFKQQPSKKNSEPVIKTVDHIQRLCENPNNRQGWHLPKSEWPAELDSVLLSVSLCTDLIELQESAEALVELSKKVAIDSAQLLNDS